MKTGKLSLDAELLRVESFRTVAGGGGRGTVLANGYTEPDYPSCAPCGASPPAPTVFCNRAMVTLAECCY